MGAKPSKPVVAFAAAAEGLQSKLGISVGAAQALFRELAVRSANGNGKDERVPLDVFRSKLAVSQPFFELGELVPQRLFQVLGGDAEGLNSEQFVCAVYVFTCAEDDEKHRLLFNMFDLQGGGFIKKREFRTMAMAIVKGSEPDLPASFDEDFKALERCLVDAGMQLYDANRDGKLSFEEWSRYATEDRAVRKCFDALGGPGSTALVARLRELGAELALKEGAP